MSTTHVQSLPNVRGRMSYTEFGEGKRRREHLENGTDRIAAQMGDAASREDFIVYCEGQKHRHPNAVNEGYEVRISWATDELDPDRPDDIQRGMEYAYTLCHELASDSMCWVTMHVDGEGGCVHAHATIANHDARSGQVINKEDTSLYAPRYWLTGKVYCGKCGSTLQGVSGTSGTGRTYYYYYCSAQRRKQCTLKKVRKEKLEDAVTMILRSILHDSENLMSLAVDAAAYYEKNYRDTGYLDGLEAKRREVEKSLANLVKVIESGLISETVTERLVQLEEQKRALNEAIEAENIRAALCEDEHTIKAYFGKFLHADFDNPETRDQVLEYFVDKIYLTDDGLVVTSWYSEDRTEVTWDMLYGEDGNPFVKGEAVKFDCFPFGSTTMNKSEPFARRRAVRIYFFRCPARLRR